MSAHSVGLALVLATMPLVSSLGAAMDRLPRAAAEPAAWAAQRVAHLANGTWLAHCVVDVQPTCLPDGRAVCHCGVGLRRAGDGSAHQSSFHSYK
jgi:hypothetical protein